MKLQYTFFIRKCVLLIGALLLLAGCGRKQISGNENSGQVPAGTPGSTVEAKAEQENRKQEVSEKELQELKPVKPDDIERICMQQGNSYYYWQLGSMEQKVYGEILYVLENQETDIPLSVTDSSTIEKVFQSVLNDHPEIFYVEGYTITRYTLGEEVKMVTFSGTYTMTPETIRENQQKIENYVQQCFANLPSGEGEQYFIAKYIYEYLIANTEYDASSPDNQNICSVFLYRRSVCQGYAKATQYLLQRAGIQAALVMGTVQNGEGHAWNLVFLDGEYYYLDTTWGDASYQVMEGSGDEIAGNIPPINYDYLCVTTAQIMKTHQIEQVVPVPLCTAMQDNYYVHEGLYFETMEEERFASVFANAYENGNNYVTLKCSSEEVYTQIRHFLIEEQGIFQFLHAQTGTVSYAENAEQLSLSFWL